MPESFYIETFGCQMNKADSELMALSLIKNGFVKAPSGAEADILLFNTCSVRLHAENRALARLRAARSAGRGGKPTLLVAAGCMAQRMGENLIEEDLADLAVGPYQSPSIGDIIQSYRSGLTGRIHLSQQRADFHTRIDPAGASPLEASPWHRWVTITHGCENFCSYCIVPRVRGPLISFKSADILAYIRRCADNGAREITLLGQNVNQYGQDNGDIPFHRLLEKAAAVPGLVRIGFLTSHPMDFTNDIVDVIADHENISRSIHLPLQSGSDEILMKMNRRYTMAEYMKKAGYI
ncbi:MAG TPA: MiaB/RimO family radical SAM methylthiotransferase, partial [Spirochaetes bacterium]|nr:MiaB/RimO family radical SAM methylthiotransferase [Spirochaetota bacterium]